MTAEEVTQRINPAELSFSASRSSGPGGQNVNKVNTKVEVRFNIASSVSFSDDEKELIYSSLGNRITGEGELLIISQSERSQAANKEKAAERLFNLIAKALTIKPPRKKTRPTAASRVRRVDKKKKRGYIKSLRKDSGIE